MTQLDLFQAVIVVPAYRITWREGADLQVVNVPAHTVRL